MSLCITLTKRTRKRKLSTGKTVHQQRYILNYQDPKTGQRRQKFFTQQKAAQQRKAELIVSVEDRTYFDKRSGLTVAEAGHHWLSDKIGKVKSNTLVGYRFVAAHIFGPSLVTTEKNRLNHSATGNQRAGARFLPTLGAVRISDLTTADIRIWYRALAEQIGAYTAKRAKSHLKQILALAEEDFGVRAPSMPTGLARGPQKPKKAILTSPEIARIIEAARADPDRGLYFAWPFLTGTRPSEQLGLLWEDIEFDSGVIRIRRIQERDGSLTQMTKTEAGTREVPIGPILRELLLAWRVRCPRLRGELHRVLPGPGRLQPWPKARTGGGGPLLYQNFRKRHWKPIFQQLQLPYVTPHSARHSFISILQAEGVEVGLVAKLAGHACVNVTLSHYTQAVRGGKEAITALESSYSAK